MININTQSKPYFIVNKGENAIVLLAQWQRQAKKVGWTEEEVSKVLDEATSGDYDNLLITLDNYSSSNQSN